MPIEPKFQKANRTLGMKVCPCCGVTTSLNDFAHTYSIFYPDNKLPICNDCIGHAIVENGSDWAYIDKVCQWAGIPFIVKEWDRLAAMNDPVAVWGVYANVFADECYQSIGWSDYFNQYKKLKEVGLLEDEIPLVKEAKIQELQEKWGSNYDEESLRYLEDLYKGMLVSQNVNGALQTDQAKKICKLSLEIDARIRAGDKDVDKFLSSYDKLVKSAEFTPKNTKNAADFDSVAELALWVEKRGYQNKFYDDVTRDVIDETLKNIENYNQRLYLNEGGIGEEIGQRLRSLKNANSMEQTGAYGLETEFDLTKYDNEGYDDEPDEEFDPEGGEII